MTEGGGEAQGKPLGCLSLSIFECLECARHYLKVSWYQLNVPASCGRWGRFHRLSEPAFDDWMSLKRAPVRSRGSVWTITFIHSANLDSFRLHPWGYQEPILTLSESHANKSGCASGSTTSSLWTLDRSNPPSLSSLSCCFPGPLLQGLAHSSY